MVRRHASPILWVQTFHARPDSPCVFYLCLFNDDRFNTVKGYGFIVPDDGGKDIFVHQTEIKCEGFRSLADGESVEYLAQTEGNGKVKATEVTGPGGAQVKGVPFQQSNDFDSY